MKGKKFIKSKRTFFFSTIALVPLATLAGAISCDNKDKGSSSEKDKTSSKEFKLQLLHFSDIDSGGDIVHNVKRFSKLMNVFKSQYPKNSLILSTGDNYITKPEFRAAKKMEDPLHTAEADKVSGLEGYAHVQWLNELGVKASALGNHELDITTDGLAEFLKGNAKKHWKGLEFPYLSANVDFSKDEAMKGIYAEPGQDVNDIKGKVSKSATVTVNGEKIGIVGASVPTLSTITKTGDLVLTPKDFNFEPSAPTQGMKDLAQIVQKSVDDLTKTGINKIIVICHMQDVRIEEQLATLLKDVDIVIGGGSNTVFQDENDTIFPGDKSNGHYPEWRETVTKEPVAVVNTGPDYKYLGRLILDFDKNGVIEKDKYDNKVSGEYAAIEENIEKYAKNVEPNANIVKLADAVWEVLKVEQGTIIGYTNYFLNGIRASIRTQETNLGDLTADSLLGYARDIYKPNNDPALDFVNGAIKNGGGIRASIGEAIVPPGAVNNEVDYNPPKAVDGIPGSVDKGISQLDIESSLAFNNKLVVAEVTGQQLKAIFENALKGKNGSIAAQFGGFPQIAGFTVEYDESKDPYQSIDYTAYKTETDATKKDAMVAEAFRADNGKRVKTLKTKDKDGNEVVIVDNYQLDATNKDTTFKIVTLEYLVYSYGNDYPTVLVGDAKLHKLYEATYPEPEQNDEKYRNGLFDKGSEQRALEVYLKKHYADAASAYDVQDGIENGSTFSPTRIIKL